MSRNCAARCGVTLLVIHEQKLCSKMWCNSARSETQRTRLGSLSNLDLHLVSICQELRGDAKPTRGHLLNTRVGSVVSLQPPQVGEGWGIALLVNIVQMLPPHWVLSSLT